LTKNRVKKWSQYVVQTVGLLSIQGFDHRFFMDAIRTQTGTIPLVSLTTRSLPDFDVLVDNGATICSPNYTDLIASRIETA